MSRVNKRAFKQIVLGFAALSFALVAAGGFVRPQVRLLVPDDSPSGPFYARLERGFVHATDEWVAVAFYRDPSCVRANFNLLNFFDFGNIPGIFGCPLTVDGFEIWENGPQVDPGPTHSRLGGDNVPIWFVSVDDFNLALPGITITELLAMPSLLQGTATFFDETLMPAGIAQQSVLRITSSGTLPDGRSFQYVAAEGAGVLRMVRIEFK